MNYIDTYHSPLGDIMLASDGEALIGLWFEGQKYFAAGLGDEVEARALPVFATTSEWLDSYFHGEQPGSMPPLLMRDTPYRRAVWLELLAIPRGKIVTYKQVAESVAARSGTERISCRAVGGAIARNPISIIVPCHRVVGSDGSLTGYAGGLDRKIALLTLEGVDVSRFRDV
ncbi:methylated-DNA/protein-cysteinemethyltransferase [Coriobacterium glomerans PW2]|uniref:Methylated-DNA--protein-cysteine methyltransferase n=1 Tax=Coriobacterium glomerans (strain ATCC 49209 / DSM 20642 / JCM 10262 / PW2) TaxID=700015 RepID=F2N9U7_CORGP|nr:methylated-DNA--[protein]-cysteine S-methyltransferase [Coriobacterium glomerans]AEB06202.1 methylated-DNA/protein-cysteinemethyltransferase [Coriobacterium glomerans PW2]